MLLPVNGAFERFKALEMLASLASCPSKRTPSRPVCRISGPEWQELHQLVGQLVNGSAVSEVEASMLHERVLSSSTRGL